MLRRSLLPLLVAVLCASLASASSHADPLATLSIDDVTVAEGDTGTVAATFTVTLSGPSEDTVTVDYATADSEATSPDDYAAIDSTTLSFEPGELSKQVTVLVNGDSVHEASEGFFVNLSNPVFADLGDAQGAGTITNDDPAPELSIDDVTVAEGNSGTVAATFTVSLNAASGQSVTVDYATADGTGTAPADYAAVSNTLTFAAGETAKQVTVLVNGDLLDEINETFSVNLTNPINATLSDAQGLGTITDDDPLPAVAIDDVTVTEQDTGTVTASFNVTLVPASGRRSACTTRRPMAPRRRQRTTPRRAASSSLPPARRRSR